MSKFELILPTGILFASFMMKLFVDQSPNLPLAVEALYELPIDVVFLASTFAAAFVISKPTQAALGLTHFGGYICLALLSVVLMRRSVKLFDEDKRWRSAFLCIVNYVISLTTLVVSMKLVSGK